MSEYRGGCLCGAVRFRATGTPLFALICHCRDCQRASGSGGVPVLGMPRAGFTVSGRTQGFASVGGSGESAVRHRCAACGSLLFGTPAVAPELVTVYAGSLDEPERFAPDRAIFVRDRPAWARLACALAETQTA